MGNDVARGPADHAPGLRAHGKDLSGLTVQRDDRGLAIHDVAAGGIDQRVGRSQIDRKGACHGELPVPAPVAPAAGRRSERGHLGVEAVHARRERRAVPVPQPEHQESDQAHADRDEEKDHTSHSQPLLHLPRAG